MQTGIRIFEEREIAQARLFASDGGQALHLMSGRFAYLRKDTPQCFKGRGMIAHLFDNDRDRLIRTARRFGVKVIRVERDGEHGQHIDLCGAPLTRARQEATQFLLAFTMEAVEQTNNPKK